MARRSCTRLTALTAVLLLHGHGHDHCPGVASAQDAMDYTKVMIGVMTTNLPIDTSQLIVMHTLPGPVDMLASKICAGLPSLVTRSSQFPSNGGCFDSDDNNESAAAANISCTCLEAYTRTDTSWTFTLRAAEPMTEPWPTTLSSDDGYGVDGILIMGLPPTLTTLELRGQGQTPLAIKLRSPPTAGAVAGDSIVHVAQATNVETLVLDNLGFSEIEVKKGFVPKSLQHLSMTNCGLTDLPTTFLESLADLQTLDLSSNHLSLLEMEAVCMTTSCPLLSLNLTDNQFDEFPSSYLHTNQIKIVSAKRNPFKNIQVTSAQREALDLLTTFEVDTLSEECETGVSTTVLDTPICVVDAAAGSSSSSAVTETTDTSGSGTNKYLVYGAVGCVVAILILVVVLIRQKRNRRHDDDDMVPIPTTGTHASTAVKTNTY